MLDHLFPILGNHSVDRSTITLYLPQEFIKPEKLFEKINKEGYFMLKFQRRNLIKKRIINIQDKENSLSIIEGKTDEDIIGFVLEQYNSEGELENILALQNNNDKAVINFETRKYIRWENFFNSFFEDFKNLIKGNEFYFEAINLTYVDEFIWKSEERIPVEEIFQKDSELINSKFLKSKNGTIVLLSQNEDHNIEEKTEISFNNELKRVQIIHQHATKFKDILDSNNLIEKDNINSLLEIAHISNKETLKDLFTETIKEKINLK
ncbi:TIGR04255 family protein [uncultured Flavobacterium sp.]|uniref:TIGR04255 family protein n=1 Tax=uncultured Flavobacterium sp. TaxID=165435 RepID=UPI0030EDC099|tara:strand:+ start:40204 stop:40998 length:795 start_codon:yes stop_codon:yes gene_type:complete